MKRLVLSLLGGILLPFSYAIVIGLLSEYIDNELSSLLILPVAWPRVLYWHVLALSYNDSTTISETSLLVLIVVCNVLLYTILTYFLLLLLSFKAVKELPAEPPLPPIFTKKDAPNNHVQS